MGKITSVLRTNRKSVLFIGCLAIFGTFLVVGHLTNEHADRGYGNRKLLAQGKTLREILNGRKKAKTPKKDKATPTTTSKEGLTSNQKTFMPNVGSAVRYQSGDWTFITRGHKAKLLSPSEEVNVEVPKDSKLLWRDGQWFLVQVVNHPSMGLKEEVLAHLGYDIFSQTGDRALTEALLGWVWEIEQRGKESQENIRVRFGDQKNRFAIYPNNGMIEMSQFNSEVKFSFNPDNQFGKFENLILKSQPQTPQTPQTRNVRMHQEFGSALVDFFDAHKDEVNGRQW